MVICLIYHKKSFKWGWISVGPEKTKRKITIKGAVSQHSNYQVHGLSIENISFIETSKLALEMH